MNQNGRFVLDIQGFYIDNKIYAKEICISEIDSGIKTFLIQPPPKNIHVTKKDTLSNRWLSNYHHGLEWYSGIHSLNDFIDYFVYNVRQYKSYPFVYVKGNEKAQWLKELLGEKINFCIINLDNLNCPNIKTLYKSNANINVCKYHNKNNSNYLCAEKNVKLFRDFIKNKVLSRN